MSGNQGQPRPCTRALQTPFLETVRKWDYTWFRLKTDWNDIVFINHPSRFGTFQTLQVRGLR